MFITLLVFPLCINAQFAKFDSTMKMGKVGYRVICMNKNLGKNVVTIKPEGFEKDARELSFQIPGRVKGAEIDDLNGDGYPDAVIYVYSGRNSEFGTAYCFASQENKMYIPMILPDILLDGKFKEGYKGYDEFQLLEGKLMRTFPLYKPDDAADKPSGGKRVIMYNLIGDANTRFEFKVLRSYIIN